MHHWKYQGTSKVTQPLEIAQNLARALSHRNLIAWQVSFEGEILKLFADQQLVAWGRDQQYEVVGVGFNVTLKLKVN